MYSKYRKKLSELRKRNEHALVVFTVIGDPDYNTSISIIKSILKGGADILELGFAFSDPIADGTTIQSADVRALSHKINTDKCFKFIKQIRDFSNVPIGLLVYYNLVYQKGIENFYRDARNSGVDSILIADMPIEEASSVVSAAKKYLIWQVFIVSPLTTNDRLKKIIKKCKGFLYLVSRLGVTGARSELESDTLTLIKRVRPFTILPLFVGFGISNPKQVKAVIKAGVDGAIIGSSVVKIIEENLGNKKLMLNRIEKYVKKMKSATKYD